MTVTVQFDAYPTPTAFLLAQRGIADDFDPGASLDVYPPTSPLGVALLGQVSRRPLRLRGALGHRGVGPHRVCGAVSQFEPVTFKATVDRLFRRRRPLKREDAAEIADWVNEGGSFDPAGPPRVIEDETDDNSSA